LSCPNVPHCPLPFFKPGWGHPKPKKSNLNLIFTRDAQIWDILEVDILSGSIPSNWNVDNPALNGSSISVECFILIPWLARVILHLGIPRLRIVTHAIIIRMICLLILSTLFLWKRGASQLWVGL
jgi:hypothetical protein